ncbi:hypothetical protein VYU27_004528 [Nannochloropsis oceanica]
MSDTINTIINAVKEMVNDMGDKVTTAVKESLHVPENLGPLVTTLKDLVSTGKKFAAGEGSSDELAGLTTQLGQFSTMVDTLDDGPLKKMVLALRDQAMGQLKDVKGAEKIMKILAVLGTDSSATATPSASPSPPVVEASIDTPATAAAPAPAASAAAAAAAPATPAVEEAVASTLAAAVAETVPAVAPTATATAAIIPPTQAMT